MGISLAISYRSAAAPTGHSVGASTEVLEAVELLEPSSVHPKFGEIDRALGFVKALADAAGLEGERAVVLATDALYSGAARRHLLELWLDHGVDSSFVSRVANNPRSAILGEFGRAEVRAAETGIVRCDWVALADIVNTRLNGFLAAGDGPAVLNPGGVEIAITEGVHVHRGETLLTAYTVRNDSELLSRLSGVFTIESAVNSPASLRFG